MILTISAIVSDSQFSAADTPAAPAGILSPGEARLGTGGSPAARRQALADNQPVEGHTRVLADTLAAALDIPVVQGNPAVRDSPGAAPDNPEEVPDNPEEALGSLAAVLDTPEVALDNPEEARGSLVVARGDGQVDARG